METEHAGGDGLRLELEEDGIAALVFGRPAASLSSATLEVLDLLLAEVEQLAADGRVRALVVRGARPEVFLDGMDLAELGRVTDATEGSALARRGQAVLRRLERLPVPTFAAVEGACVGAGAELALACAYRLASLADATRFALPEVQLGLIPALGGTVRLPRLIGVREALGLILTGRSVGAREAERLGLVDAALPAEDFAAETRRFVVERLRRGRLRTGARRGVARRLVEDTAPGRRLVFARLRRELARAEGGRPAARRALEAVADGVGLPLDRAFEKEAEALGELLVGPEARGLLHASRLRRASGARNASAATGAPEFGKTAVLGAGRTGTGITYLLAAAGVPVRLRETRHDALLEGLDRLRALFREAVRQERLPRTDAEERAPLVVGTLGFGGFGTVEVVLEATRDEEARKRAVLRQVEEHVREGCVLVTTAAAARIGRVQEAVSHPERVVGMHFVPPVAWGGLVEVVRGERTSDATAAAAFALARRMGKAPIGVKDRPGFLVNRLLVPFLNEALRLLEEGATVAQVEGAMTGFGMSLGPLRLVDELGVSRVARLSRFLADGTGGSFLPSPLLDTLAEAAPGTEAEEFAFYRYERGKAPRISPRAAEALRSSVRPKEGGIPEEEVRSRLVLLLVNEAARALEEGVVGSAAEVDLAMLLGAGFPASRGGPLFYADLLGAAEVVAALEEHARRYGERFAPAPLLRRLAGEGGRFFDAAEPFLLDMPADG